MKSRILAVLLILSITANFYTLFLYQPVQQQKNLQELENRINNLERTNAELNKQLYRDNITLQNYASTLDVYRQRIALLESKLNATPTALTGFTELQAPAVIQRVEYIQDYPFIRQQVVEEGTMMNISAEVKPGKGRVLVQTKPLMGVVFQDAANTAVFIAQKRTGRDLSGSDIIFSIEAQSEIPSVDGPSAGALMALLVISSLENRELKKDVTLTGTIDQDGNVGRIGGVVEKAAAAKESGKNLFLLPSENDKLVRYTERTRDVYGIRIIDVVPETIDTKEYIEANVGIKAEYVGNINDILEYAS